MPKKLYSEKNLKQVADLVTNGKMKKCRAIEAAGFKSRQSYYSCLHRLGYEEILIIRKFQWDNKVKREIQPGEKRISFI